MLAPLLVGMCATDLELIDGSLIYLRTGQTTLPMTPGHEWVGRVVGSGSDVTTFAAGDTVVGECSVGCDACPTCAAGAYHRCPNKRETGIIGIGGALAQRMVFPARSAHRVPDGMALEDAALVEPTAVAFRAMARLDPPPGASLLVVGGGTLGYLSAVLAMSVRHLDVAVLDTSIRNTARLAEVGARNACAGETFDYVLEAAGTPSALASALDALRPGGRIVLIGLTGEPTVPVAVDRLVVGDQTVQGSIGSPGVWPDVIALLATGAIRPSTIVTHTFGLEDFPKAVDLLRSNTDHSVGKVLIAPSGAR